jgi:glutamyl-tRNA(Gln) amidotransferase subunit D
MEQKPGDNVEIKLKDEAISGTIMPSTDENFVVIKLGNGYNVGISKKKIKEIKVVQKHEKKPEKKEGKPHAKKGLPNISILHLGGTVASKVDYATGGVTASFSPDELVKMFPELKEIANIKSRLVSQMMSENMRFAHYNIIAKEIEKEIKEGADGIIVTHGTDTLHYTSAALSFMLDNLAVPVILVGSQRSSDRGSSDAGYNLLSAATFISCSNFSEVAICMHKNSEDDICWILPGTKTRKMHTSRRDAFRPINAKAYAEIHYKQRQVNFLRDDYKKKSGGKLSVKLFNEKIKVGIIKCHTNMFADEFESFKGYDGLIIEGMGLGQIPNSKIDDLTKESEKIIHAVAELAKKTVVCLAPQTIYGRVNMNVYSEGRKNLEAGIIGDYCDMTPETAFIKLSWLLSNYSKEDAKKLYLQNLAGEISERTEKETFLV